MGTAMNIPLPTNAAGHAQGRVDASPAAVAVGEQAVARLRARLVNLMQLPMSANRRGSSMSARSKPPGSRKAMFARILKARHEDRTLAATALEKAAAANVSRPSACSSRPRGSIRPFSRDAPPARLPRPRNWQNESQTAETMLHSPPRRT